MKRKAEKQQLAGTVPSPSCSRAMACKKLTGIFLAAPAAPVSAFAARKARQQQQQQSQQEDVAITVNRALQLESQGEPPSKKARRLSEREKESTPQSAAGEEDSLKRLALRKKKDSGKTNKSADAPSKSREEARTVKDFQAPSDIESEIEQTSVVEANPDDAVASINGDADGYSTYGLSFDRTS